MSLEVETEQARQLEKEATAKAAALVLEKEAALQTARAATRLATIADARLADALDYADRIRAFATPVCVGRAMPPIPFVG